MKTIGFLANILSYKCLKVGGGRGQHGLGNDSTNVGDHIITVKKNSDYFSNKESFFEFYEIIIFVAAWSNTMDLITLPPKLSPRDISRMIPFYLY